MLLRFRATNFASLRDEQELSLIALDDHADLATTVVPLSGERVLPVAGIFGANASGKSNVLKAMEFASAAVTGSHQLWLPEDPIPRWPFRLDGASRRRPSEFSFEFVHDGIRYEYAFSFDDHVISKESLRSWPKGTARTLYVREGTEISFGPSLTGQKALIAEVVRENSLFLSAAAANNHAQLRPVAAWFDRLRRIRSGPVPIGPPFKLDDAVVDMLRFADIGIVGSAIVERGEDELELGRVRRRRRSPRQSISDQVDGRNDLADGNTSRTVARLELIHQAATESGSESLPWHWESAGTQSWLRIGLLATTALSVGSILMVDDLGNELHPLLTAQLVGIFQDPRTNRHGAQLIFTGHDVSLLGKHVEHRLHRDQVWLTAKDGAGATTLYPLTEYGRVRDGLDDVEGRYLQGRYGAVPFFDQELLKGIGANGESK